MQTNKSNGQLTAQINVDDHKKSGFDLSNNVLGTGKIGRIIPTRALHVMPNDTIKADSKVAVQFEPLAVPILANMDVKQEHFYVPYNIVWKNWDKFISGGEKLDYQGVVPNVSMREIISSVSMRLFRQSGFYLSMDVSNTGIVVRIDINCQQFVDKLSGIEQQLDEVGAAWKIKDLLRPQYEVLKKLRELCNMYQDAGEPVVHLFSRGSASSYYQLSESEKNKYFDQIAPALIANDSNMFWHPVIGNMEFLNLMYEFYKPFIGLGSNIDYLNMGRITFTDFLYIMCMDLYEYTELQSRVDHLDYVLKDSWVSSHPISILNLRANYNIWYNNYRDILLEADAYEPIDIDSVSQDELFTLLVPRQRCWEKDAFTTALDSPGTGNVGVPVNLTGDMPLYNNSLVVSKYQSVGNGQPPFIDVNGSNIAEVTVGDETYRVPTSYLSGVNSLEIGGMSSNGFSLYALDAAQRAQKWLQKALFFGNRISDFYYMHFGVRFLDARLRLPELLTSSSELVKLDVVMNNTNITTEAGGEVYQSIAGDRAAYASAYDNGNSFERYCEEHGVIMSYLTIMPQVTYAYGMNRDYSRLDQYDFAFSEFATLGMDAVYDSEITICSVELPDNGYSNDIKVFGYQGKYYDYKAKHSEEHGELLDSQDMYTFARKFNMYDPNGRPKLNYEFVHCFPDLDMFVVDSSLSDYFRYDIRHSTAAERNLPSQCIYI